MVDTSLPCVGWIDWCDYIDSDFGGMPSNQRGASVGLVRLSGLAKRMVCMVTMETMSLDCSIHVVGLVHGFKDSTGKTNNDLMGSVQAWKWFKFVVRLLL